jgi:hypothetical protein
MKPQSIQSRRWRGRKHCHALDRLTTASGPGGVTSIGYDVIGNITSKAGIAGTLSWTTGGRNHAGPGWPIPG